MVIGIETLCCCRGWNERGREIVVERMAEYREGDGRERTKSLMGWEWWVGNKLK